MEVRKGAHLQAVSLSRLRGRQLHLTDSVHRPEIALRAQERHRTPCIKFYFVLTEGYCSLKKYDPHTNGINCVQMWHFEFLFMRICLLL